MRTHIALLLPLLLLAACAPAAAPGAAATPILSATATARPTATASEAATAAPDESTAPAVAPDGTDYSQVAGRNADGTFYRGATDAPVTLVDHSDFL